MSPTVTNGLTALVGSTMLMLAASRRFGVQNAQLKSRAKNPEKNGLNGVQGVTRLGAYGGRAAESW